MPEGTRRVRLLCRDRSGAAVRALHASACLASAALSLLAGCNLGPRYHRPVDAVAKLHGGALQLLDNHPGLLAQMVLPVAAAPPGR